MTFCGGEPLLVARSANTRAYSPARETHCPQHQRLAAGEARRPGIQPRAFDRGTVDRRVHARHAPGHARARRGPDEALSAADLVVRQPGTRLKIGTVVSAVNSGDLRGLAELIQRLQPDVWRLYQYSSRGWQSIGQQRHHLPDEEFLRFAEQAADLVAPVPVAFSTQSQTACCLIIDPAGTVLRPAGSGYEDCGNCLKERLDDIWARSPAVPSSPATNDGSPSCPRDGLRRGRNCGRNCAGLPDAGLSGASPGAKREGQ